MTHAVQLRRRHSQTGRTSDDGKKLELEQYFTSKTLAGFMASMMEYGQKEIHLLDPGAGTGSLFSACVEYICGQRKRGEHSVDKMSVTAYEIDRGMYGGLRDAMDSARRMCRSEGIRFCGRIVCRDIIDDYVGGEDRLTGTEFTHVIANPPYKKITASSPVYGSLREAGIYTTNLYAVFVDISCAVLGDGGQITFISPRSFCNGAYFRRFRERFLGTMSLRRMHLFDSRSSSFKDDGVLQENVIVSAAKRMGGRPPRSVTVSSSAGPQSRVARRTVRLTDMVACDDPQFFIHIPTRKSKIQSVIGRLGCTLDELGISVSTGRVVDFRIRDKLRFRPDADGGAVPLVRPFNISCGTVNFPVTNKKHHNFVVSDSETRSLLVENGSYVLVKRFTTKEEKRRVVSAVWDRDDFGSGLVGFENRTNYFHRSGRALHRNVASGLRAFLNSSIVDEYFRQFNGNTQVNATDLRYLRYPAENQIRRLGAALGRGASQEEIDEAVGGEIIR